MILLPDAPKFPIFEGNNSFLSIINSTNEEIEGKDIGVLFSVSKYFKDVGPALIDALQQVIKTNDSQKISIGDIEYLEMSPIFSDNHEIEFIVLYYFNRAINDFNCCNRNHLKENESLKISAEKYEKLFHLSLMPKWVYELETLQILDVNESALKKYEYSREEFLNKPFVELRSYDQILHLYKDAEIIENQNELIHFGIFTHFKKDKTPIKVEISGTRFSFKDKKCVMVVCMDVTERESALMQLEDITEEKLLKLSIEESNQRFDYATRATFDAIWDWDLIKDKSYWGDGFARTFGYNLSLINSDPDFWNNHIHPEDFESVIKLINQSIHGDANNWTIEYRFQKADGEYAYIIDKCIIIRDKTAKAIRLVGAMQDITEKKTLQQLLDKANRLAKIGSWEIDVASSTVYWSDITKEIRETGPDYEPTLEEGIGYFKEGYSKNTIAARVKDSMENGTSWQEDLQIYTHTGKLKWVRTTGKAELKDEKCIKIYGSFQDIDQSKKAELEIQNLYEEKNAILESIDDGFFTVDKNWIVTYWNKEAEKMLATSKQEILGKNLWDTFPDHVNSHSFRKYNEAIKSSTRIFFEDYYASLDRWFEISAYPSKRGLSVYFKDISERITAQMELNELNLTLQKTAQDLAISNAELEQFAYIASHDLQEPLRMITNFLTQLEKKYKDILDEKGKQYIYFAVDGAKRMRQIILDLLEFSRVGRFDEKKEKVDVNEIVEEVVSLYQNQIEETSAIVHFNELPIVKGYKSPISQVIQNLVSNALKYHSKDEKPFIEIEAEEMEFQWKFFVKDNGIGIEPDYYHRIFDIFQRLHKKEEYSGTGIGLAIVKKIITAMGGEIRIEPNGKKGSIFIFTIPK